MTPLKVMEKEAPSCGAFSVLNTPEIGVVESPPVPAKQAKQARSGLGGVVVKPSEGFTVPAVFKFPAAPNTLKDDDVHMRHPLLIAALSCLPCACGARRS